MKKLLLAIVVTYVVLMGTNYLIHGLLLMPDYDLIRPSFRSIQGIERRFWAMALGQFIFAVLFVYVFVRGAERKPWVGQGIRYGIIIAFLTVVPSALAQYDTYLVNYELVIKWMALEGIQMIVLALIVAAIYRDAGSRA